MKKYRKWVLMSLMLSGCTLQPQLIEIQQPLDEKMNYDNVSEDNYLGYVHIDGVLYEGFVQGKDNQEYLYQNADGTPSQAGASFLDYRCTEDSDNLIVYGHSSRTSQILFTPLMNYLDDEFAKEHNEIELIYNGNTQIYQIMSVFLFDVKGPGENDWMQIDFQKKFLFEQAVKRLKEKSRVDLDFKWNDQLLTLVTCNTENHSQRLIVIGMKKTEHPLSE